MLSIGERVTLINSVVSSLPLYFFSFYQPAPKGNNILGKMGECMQAKGDGGLGVKIFELFNVSLLTKWKWRCLTETDAICHELLSSR